MQSLSEYTEAYWVAALSLSPKTGAIADQLVDRYAKKYHAMLYATAGYISNMGFLSSQCLESAHSPTGTSPADEIDGLLELVIIDLQDAGIIPKAAWYQPVALYVLHFIVIPFVRAVLTQSHYPVK